MVAQSFCLANLQSTAPLLAVAAASIVNIVGDLCLAKHGVAGAAMATALASMVSTTILMKAVRRQFVQWRRQEVDDWKQTQETRAIRQDLYADSNLDVIVPKRSIVTETKFANSTEVWALEEVPPRSSQGTGTAFLEKAELVNEETETVASPEVREEEPPKAISFFSMPSRKSVVKLATISGPLCVNMWAKMASYAALTVKATSFGVVPLAAHNVLMRLFFFLGCFADSMGLSAQAFLPPTLYPLDKLSYRAVLDRLRGLTTILSVMIGQGALALVHFAGPYLARDGAMRAAMSSQASLLGWALFLHPLVVLSEGTVIATRDFSNLMKSYGAALAIHCVTLGNTQSFGGVWQAMVVFQALRFVNLNIFRQKNPIREAKATEAAY
jgi:Na+-driven multidrug efflux pump